MQLVRIAEDLRDALQPLRFSPPVSHVYNPLEYAWPSHRLYLERYGSAPKEVLLFGMNPGPWGMTQTGIPFGEVAAARDWLKVEAPVGRPAHEHPKRPVEGYACRRSEVSGRRVWGWVRRTFGSPEAFFDRFFIANYCPLVFLESSGRNRTPDKLPAQERHRLTELCDRALRRTIEHLKPRLVVGIGNFAESRAQQALAPLDVQIGKILHPSPASPLANRGWAVQAHRQLLDLGIEFGPETPS